jgi:hypothetical protein
VLRKTVDGYLYEEFIYCGCKTCGKTRPKYDESGRERKFIRGHTGFNGYYGKTFEEIRNYNKKMIATKRSQTIILGYSGVHKRVKQKLPKPELCMLCLKSKAKELACITSIYNDELRNWAWFCGTCHKKWDNIGIRRRIKQKKSILDRIGVFYISNLNLIVLLQYR